MARILVVDDSAVDRRLVQGLLSPHKIWTIDQAENGQTALAKIKSDPPDLVLSDLIMPAMDGLQLVSELKQVHPEVPVIIVTGKGSEWMAVKALQRGAASYVPKSKLSEVLVEAVGQVLEMVEYDRSYKRLIEGLRGSSYLFEVESDPLLIPPMVKLFQQMAISMRLCDAVGRNQLGVALDEALLNAMFHGNLELPRIYIPEARAAIRLGRNPDIVQQRLMEPPYRDRCVRVEAHFGQDEARFRIQDEGGGFEPDLIPAVGDAKPVRDEGGRGLVLIQNLMDQVNYRDSGRQLEMVKKCPS
jgi:CheY-like chemotaxis protein